MFEKWSIKHIQEGPLLLSSGFSHEIDNNFLTAQHAFEKIKQKSKII
jgi:hypothetical protein